MQNLKIRVNSKAEAEEVKRLAVKAGYTLDALFGKKWSAEFCYLVLCENMSAGFANEIMADGDKPLSIGKLRAMANPVKEYLVPQNAGGFMYKKAYESKCIPDSWIEIPEGAEAFGYTGIVHTFYKDDFRSFFNENTDGQWDDRGETWIGRKDPVILWQRATHPEELPFIDDEPKYTDDEVKYMDENGQGRLQSLNDQYAEIEQVRQAVKVKSGSDSDHALDAMSFGLMGAGAASGGAKDNVNHPSHYADSAIECIDAMEAMMTPEQFIGYLRGNLFKYQWRYEKKNGIEDLKKAQWYLEKLTAKVAEKNAPF